MPSFAELPTINFDTFSIGDRTSGAKTLRFRSGSSTLNLQAQPTAATTLTLPDATGTLAVQLDGFYNARCAYQTHFTRSGFFRGFIGDNNGSGTGQTSVTPSTYDRPGIVSNSTGTTTTGRSAITSVASSVLLGYGRCLLRTSVLIPTLSTATQRFKVIAGYVNILSGNQPSEGVYWRYGDNDNAGKWQAVTITGGVENVIDSGVTVAANTWYTLALEINSTATSATFFLNGSNVGSLGGLPITTAIQYAVSIRKTAGTTARTVQIDHVYAGVNV